MAPFGSVYRWQWLGRCDVEGLAEMLEFYLQAPPCVFDLRHRNHRFGASGVTRVRGVPLAGEALHNFSLINKHNRPDDHTVTLVDIEWHAHEEHVLLAEQSIDVE